MFIKSPDSGKGKDRAATKRKSSASTGEESLVDSQPDSKKQHTDTVIPIEEENGLILGTVKETHSQCPWSSLPQRGARKNILKSGTKSPNQSDTTKEVMKFTTLQFESPKKTQDILQ